MSKGDVLGPFAPGEKVFGKGPLPADILGDGPVQPPPGYRRGPNGEHWDLGYWMSHGDGSPMSWHLYEGRTEAPLPADSRDRKAYPLATGLLDYFPDALVAVAHVSYVGNEQHNPGKPLRWDRTKSANDEDTLLRHFLQRGTIDTDGVRHSAKVAWRALAMLQKEIEASR